MYNLWITVNTLMVIFLHLMHGFEHGSVKRTVEWSEQQLRKVASLEEFLRIIHPEDWKLWKCQLKLKSMSILDSKPVSHRTTRFAAAFYDIERLKIIDEEWQRTQCVPREICVGVAKELGTATNKFFKPPCVNVYRCGGCCNEESLTCVNTSTSYVTKMIIVMSLLHQSHCPYLNKLCYGGWTWDNEKSECVIDKDHPDRRKGLPPLAELAMCAPNMDFDEENCECFCKWKCTGNLFQNKENCSCYLCTETQESCSNKHKTFNEKTCSCEDRCSFHDKVCTTARPVCSRHCHCPKGG
ncbi:vascular endothelial growth factor D [Erythrolamprus reginae]|uniref:vascular endothelial growth factor D n=1 Tax=Erythrolamprus reginae TaxID=121349 RepID=UPI00396CCACF